MANGDMIEYKNQNPFVDDHRGEDGHKYIGEMVGNFIKHGIEPDLNAEDREHCKKIMLEKMEQFIKKINIIPIYPGKYTNQNMIYIYIFNFI